MKRILLLVLVSLFFTMCKTPSTVIVNDNNSSTIKDENLKDELFYTEQIKNDFRSVSDAVKKDFLNGYKATDAKYSILFFTQGFSGEEIIVKNSEETVFKGKISSDKKTGLAKNMRILNTENNSVFDNSTNKTIFIDSKMASEYKFIYVMKDLSNKEKPYKITYSNLLRPVK